MSDNPPPPLDSTSNGGEDHSPQSRRQSLPSPWASVVRGDSGLNSSPVAVVAPDSSLEQTSSPDNSSVEGLVSEVVQGNSDVSGYSNAGEPLRSVWNRPSDGVVQPASVMGGAVSWPTLSETTRPIMRSSSDNSRTVYDGSTSPSQDPIISQPPQRPTNDNPHANSTLNNPLPTRPRPRNRVSSQNTLNAPPIPMPPPSTYFEVTYGMVHPSFDPSARGTRPVGGSQSHTGNDYSHRNNPRRGGFGGRPRADGQYQNNHVGRRDQVRRDVHHLPHYVPLPMGYMPPPMPPGMPPLVPTLPISGFHGQMGFDMASTMFYAMPSPDSFRPIPIGPPPPPAMLLAHANENTLTNMIVKQIDFYFSNDNLAKDQFLRSHMNDQGWVSVHLIANFRRVQELTNSTSVILEALKHSTVVEVQGENMRRRNEWKKWIHASGSKSATALTSSLEQVSLDDTMTNANGNTDANEGHAEIPTDKLLTTELTGDDTAKSLLANGDDTAEKSHI